MPLICAGTQLLRKSSTKNDIDVCDAFVNAIDAAVEAKNAIAEKSVHTLASRPCATIRGNDTSLLTVLQREYGAVAPSEYNVVSRNCLQSRIASIDATTCLIVALRDPYSGTTVAAHFDQGDDQIDLGFPSMLNHLPPKPVATVGLLSSTEEREAVDNLMANFKAKRVVQLYIVGSVKFPKFSAETLAAALRCMADDMDVVYDVRLDGTCVWSQNVGPEGKGLIHRGLMVDAKSGLPSPVECDTARAYPAGRLRGLRCFDAEQKQLSSITLMPGETVSTAQEVDEVGRRRALQYVIIVRPFKWPPFSLLMSRKPTEFFTQMSTTPDMEPADFGEVFKAAVVFGSLTSADKVFTPHPRRPREPSPVAFQLVIGEDEEASDAPSAAKPAAGEEGDAPAAAETAGDAAAAGDAADAAATANGTEEKDRSLAFHWLQISPAQQQQQQVPVQ